MTTHRQFLNTRSRVHMLTVAAARLEQDCANPKLIADLRETAKLEAKRLAEGRAHNEEAEKRGERLRSAFALLPDTQSRDTLKRFMLQRAYDLLWDGDHSACDALCEFLPDADVRKMLDAWDDDWTGKIEKSRWYSGGYEWSE